MSDYKAHDGHKLDSKEEKIIDDVLYSFGLIHEIHQYVPKSNFKCDWKVGDIYVEYFGMKGLKQYDEEMDIKKKFYEENYPYVEHFFIEKEDLNTYTILTNKINKLRNNPKAHTQKAIPEGLENKNNKYSTNQFNLDQYQIAEEIAELREPEKMQQINEEISNLEIKNEELNSQIKEINKEINGLKETRKSIINMYI